MAPFICFDIGGTKVQVVIFTKQTCDYRIIYEKKVQTQLGLSALKNILKMLFGDCLDYLATKSLSCDPCVYIAMVGEFKSDLVLKPGSAFNLCSFDTEFDNLDLNVFFKSCFGKFSFKILNDALSQCYAGMYSFAKNYKTQHKIISYLGLGTGLGGAFFDSSLAKNGDFFSDGHVSRVLIESRFSREYVNAESLLSNVFFKTLFKKNADQILLNDVLLTKFKKELELFKYHFFDLFDCLFGINSIACSTWSDNEIKIIKKTSLLLIGGSIGTSSFVVDQILFDFEFRKKCKELDIFIYVLDSTSYLGSLGTYLYYN